MIIQLRQDATAAEREALIRRLSYLGMTVHESEGMGGRILAVVGDEDRVRDQAFDSFPGVEKVVPLAKPYKLASREFQPEGHVVRVGAVEFGGATIPVIAGHAPSRTAPISRFSRARSRRRAHRSCAAARSSRARRPTRSRASGSRG